MQGVWKGRAWQWYKETHWVESFGGGVHPLQPLWKDIQVKKDSSSACVGMSQLEIHNDNLFFRAREPLRKHKASYHSNMLAWNIYIYQYHTYILSILKMIKFGLCNLHAFMSKIFINIDPGIPRTNQMNMAHPFCWPFFTTLHVFVHWSLVTGDLQVFP